MELDDKIAPTHPVHFFTRTPQTEKMLSPLQSDWNISLSQQGASARPIPVDLDASALLQSIDFSQMNEMFQSFLQVMGLPVAIIDLNAHVLASSNWQRVCMQFHRVHAETLHRCIESDTVLARQMEEGKEYAIYRCHNGLIDCASPIVVEGKHVANLFIGQFFTAEPDMDFFRAQQQAMGFDAKEYFAAIAELPIVPEQKLPAVLDMLTNMANLIAAKSLSAQRERDARIEVEQRMQERTSELSLSENKFHVIAENAPLGIRVSDSTKIAFYQNPKFFEMFGYSLDEVSSEDAWWRLAHPDEQYRNEVRQRWHAAREVAIHNHGSITPQEMLVTCKDGSHKYAEFRFASNGELNVVIAIDITERKKSEEALRASEARLSSIINASPIPMALNDEHGNITYLNRAFIETVGYSQQDIPTLDEWWPRAYPDPQYREWIAKTWQERLEEAKREQTNFVPMEVNIRCKEGSIRTFMAGAASLQGSFSATHLVTLYEITDLKQAETEIRKLNEELEQRVTERTSQLMKANKSKDDFLATMSHEIRTPLGGLLGMMELLAMSELETKQRGMLQTARDSGDNLLRIVDDILDWSKIEAGKLELSPRAAGIKEMLYGVCATYARVASSKGIVLKHHFDENISALHTFDPLRLSQVLNNFTSNAIKFTERGEVEVSVQLMGSRDAYEVLRFSVRDTGVGIDEKGRARLFHLYEQGSAEIARMYGGTGLGLAICRSLANLMGGTLAVESQPGMGSSFSITLILPVAQHKASRTQAAQNELIIEPLKIEGRQISVLVVDDHPLNRKLMKQQLELLRVQVEVAQGGVEALEKHKETRFDLIIADCHMPEMDGYELTRNIRILEQRHGGQRKPIIAWTANVMEDEKKFSLAAGMDDLLTKPVDMPTLRAMLVKWLSKAGVLK